MNTKNLFLLIMLAGVCSVTHAADIRTTFVNTLPGTQLAIDRGEQIEVPLVFNVDQNASITNVKVWYNLNRLLNSAKISLYNKNGVIIDHYDEGLYDPDTTYCAASNEPEIDIVGEGGLNIKGAEE